MKSFIHILLILLAFVFCLDASAREFHVSTKGSDLNPGTPEKPFLTISAAAGIALAGDTITVHEGIYREKVVPIHGGKHDLSRILYRAATGEKVVIKGSEIARGWEKTGKKVWKTTISNEFFGEFNPFSEILEGDWLNKKGINHHCGEVFLNGKALFEKNTVAEVEESLPYPDARNREASIYTWHAEVGETNTTIWANFQDSNPNKELVEITVRQSCFYPAMPGINYITIRGFVMDQAATQWAAPTAEQIGLIGTHWSKGWIIEDNVISNSKAVGITLGKDRSTGQDVWMHNPIKDGATHYNEVIFRALEIGWSKEKIGSHIVRRNEIFDCGQAGIVGSLGGVFSQIYDNHIHDIWTRRIWHGAEMAGIKIHASIDMLIKHNRIHNTGRGIWIDWMAQGTRITGNLLYDNTTDDLFAEVNHGPYLVDNNLFLSENSLRDWSEGGAFVHNLFAGNIQVRKVLGRFTPYHLPHSTKVAGIRNIFLGDNRFHNNIFLGQGREDEKIDDDHGLFYGLHGYRIAGYENQTSGNVYMGKASQGKDEKNAMELRDTDSGINLKEDVKAVFLTFKGVISPEERKTELVTTEILGSTLVSEAIWEREDGRPYLLDRDYMGNIRDADHPHPGPFEITNREIHTIQIW